jgi:hypothetical protein
MVRFGDHSIAIPVAFLSCVEVCGGSVLVVLLLTLDRAIVGC